MSERVTAAQVEGMLRRLGPVAARQGDPRPALLVLAHFAAPYWVTADHWDVLEVPVLELIARMGRVAERRLARRKKARCPLSSCAARPGAATPIARLDSSARRRRRPPADANRDGEPA